MSCFGNLDKSLLKIKSLGFYPENILDIGACIGNWSVYVHNNIYPLSNYELIEPILYKELTRFKTVNNINCIQALLSDTVKEVDWYQKNNTGDSIYKENTKIFNNCEAVKRNTTTLELMYKDKHYDLIKIDTQGSEIDILRGGINLIKKASFIILEIPFLGEYNKGAPQFHEHIEFMHNQGFVPFDLPDQHRIDDFLIQIDIIFIKKNHPILEKVQDSINKHI